MYFDVLGKGIPDDAYKLLSGDDKECALFFKKQNKNEREKKANTGMDLFEEPIKKAAAELTVLHWKLENIQNSSLADIEEKRVRFENLRQTPEYRKLKKACDFYVSAFYAIKSGKEPQHFTIAPTGNDVQRACAGLDESQFSKGVNVLVAQVTEENKFFHWPLEFPGIFQKGGFDCVLGNPPWEVSQLNEEEFFAQYSDDIANAKGAVRKQKIEELKSNDLSLWNRYLNSKRKWEVNNTFYRGSDRFRLTAIGKINTYALFAELILNITNKKGRAGFIVPTGIATDDNTKNYFMRISSANLVSLYDFENREKLFPDVDSRKQFSLLSLGEGEYADFSFF
jgi:hypothetical protein